MGFLESLLASSYRVYSLLVVLFIYGWYFLKIKDNKIVDLLDILNLVFVFVSLLNGVLLVRDLMIQFGDNKNDYEFHAFTNRFAGPYWFAYWSFYFCSTIVPQIFWWKKFRRSFMWSLIVLVLINAGEAFEWLIRLIINLRRDFIPSTWQLRDRFYGSMDFYAMVFFLIAILIVYRLRKANGTAAE